MTQCTEGQRKCLEKEDMITLTPLLCVQYIYLDSKLLVLVASFAKLVSGLFLLEIGHWTFNFCPDKEGIEFKAKE